jgi:glycosyltransferase involved in cell wall biosynthesis
MLHIHRHIVGLRSFRPVVIAQKREGDWPVDRIEIVKRSPRRFLARASEKRSGRPWQISNGEAGRILAVIERENCALLHVFFGNVAVHLLPLLRRCPVPVVISFHGSDVAGSMASAGYSGAVAELFGLATAVPCRSKQLVSRVVRLGCPETKARLMRTVLPDLPFVQRDPPIDGAWQIVQAARLVPKKGLNSPASLRSLWSPISRGGFVIAGDGPMEGSCVAANRDRSPSEIRGICSQDDVATSFSRSHIFFIQAKPPAGDVEGVPNAMLEAMASGLPVVATRHGGIPEVIEHGRNGLLCAEKDAEGVAAALLQLASDTVLYQTLAQQASASVREQFSKERQVAVIEVIYGDAIRAHSERTSANARS